MRQNKEKIIKKNVECGSSAIKVGIRNKILCSQYYSIQV